MKHTNKKGFTIVELVIVIAVIAILAAVLIPTFSNLIKKANQSSDIQLIRNLNNAVAAAAKEDITIAEAIAAAATFDIAVDDIEAKAKGNKILWDDVAKVFCYLNGDTVEYISNVATAGTGANLWIIDTDGDTETDAAYSSYVLGVAEGATINAKNGIDVTGCPTVTVNYAEAGNVNIYTKASDTLVINNAGAEVDHYGAAALVDVKEAVRFAKEIGAIPSICYLGDVGDSVTGDKKAQKFEDEILDDYIPVIKEIGFEALAYMPSRNTDAQIARIDALCRKYDFLQISGEDINQPRQKFVCMKLREPGFKHLEDATWALVGHEYAATEDKEAGIYSDKTKAAFPNMEDRIADDLHLVGG